MSMYDDGVIDSYDWTTKLIESLSFVFEDEGVSSEHRTPLCCSLWSKIQNACKRFIHVSCAGGGGRFLEIETICKAKASQDSFFFLKSGVGAANVCAWSRDFFQLSCLFLIYLRYPNRKKDNSRMTTFKCR